MCFIVENRMSKEQWLSPEENFNFHNFSLKLAIFVVPGELIPLDILFFALGRLRPQEQTRYVMVSNATGLCH